MLCNVVFKFLDGSTEVFASDVDLDYWNIRQWRLLYFRLSKLNEKDYVNLEIHPLYNELF